MTLSRPKVLLIALIALAVVLLANTHLIYVAFSSQPACVAHSRTGAEKMADGPQYSAAQSAC